MISSDIGICVWVSTFYHDRLEITNMDYKRQLKECYTIVIIRIMFVYPCIEKLLYFYINTSCFYLYKFQAE